MRERAVIEDLKSKTQTVNTCKIYYLIIAGIEL